MENAEIAVRLESALEAILFASGEAVPVSGLAKALGIEREEALRLINKLAAYYSENARGIKLIEADGSYQLCANSGYSAYITALIQAPQKKTLTPALIETLAIIAYKQPVTKTQIEEIRGVSAEHAVNKLIEYGLAREDGRLDSPGRPILFATTEEFLKFYGLKNLGELPELSGDAGFAQLTLEDADIPMTADM